MPVSAGYWLAGVSNIKGLLNVAAVLSTHLVVGCRSLHQLPTVIVVLSATGAGDISSASGTCM